MDRWAYYVNQLGLSGESWRLEKTTISVNAAQSEYALNAVNFGKPVVVYLLDDTRQTIIGELEVVRFQDQVTGSYSNIPAGYSVPATFNAAARNTITFFTESGQTKARILNTPSDSGTLIVYYVPTGLTLSTLQANLGLLDMFANLFKIHTAIMCLPDCEWTGLSEDQNESKRNRIEKTLLMEFALLTAQFDEYRMLLFREQTSKREGWGDSEEYGYVEVV